MADVERADLNDGGWGSRLVLPALSRRMFSVLAGEYFLLYLVGMLWAAGLSSTLEQFSRQDCYMVHGVLLYMYISI